MELAHSPHQPRPDTPLQLLSAHAKLSKGGESAHRRKRQSGMNRFSTPSTSQMELAHSTPRCQKAEKASTDAQNRLHEAACFAIVCFMKMNAPERNSFFRDQNEPCNTQYIVVACSFLYIIQFIYRFFKGKNAVLSFLYMRNDDLHNYSLLSLCIIFLIFLVLEVL